jgi:hypothetical protein
MNNAHGMTSQQQEQLEAESAIMRWERIELDAERDAREQQEEAA